jgi:YVTN family beta-propeller protein
VVPDQDFTEAVDTVGAALSQCTAVLSLRTDPEFARSARATVIATIPVGLSPAWLAFDTRNGRVYVANIFSDDVSVIDPRTNTVVDTIPLAGGFVCAHPFAVGYDPRHDVVYVACQQYTMATAISGRTDRPIGDPIEVGSSPFGIAFDRRNDHLYIAVAHTQDVAVLDAATRAVIDRVPIPPAPGQSESEPFGIAYDDRNGELYVAESASPEVSVVDGSTNNVLKTIPTPSTSRGIAYDPRTGEIYVANFEAGSVSVIDDTTAKTDLHRLFRYMIHLSIS